MLKSEILREYVKKVLNESKFDHLPLTQNLISVILDELMETEKPIKYKEIIIELETFKRIVKYIYVSSKIPMVDNFIIYPIKKYILLEQENFINETFDVLVEHLRILEFKRKFIKFLKETNFKKTQSLTDIFWNKKIDKNHIRIKLTDFSQQGGNRAITILVWYRSDNFPLPEHQNFKISLRGDEHFFRDPDEIIQEVKEQIEKIEERIREDEEND